MHKENQQLLTDEPVAFEKQPLEIQDFRRISDRSMGICEIFLNPMKKNHKMPTHNRFTLERHPRFRLNTGYIWPISSQHSKSFKTKYMDAAFNPTHATQERAINQLP